MGSLKQAIRILIRVFKFIVLNVKGTFLLRRMWGLWPWNGEWEGIWRWYGRRSVAGFGETMPVDESPDVDDEDMWSL